MNDSIYLTVNGTSAEVGDDDEVDTMKDLLKKPLIGKPKGGAVSKLNRPLNLTIHQNRKYYTWQWT
jgi:hypothetical protein